MRWIQPPCIVDAFLPSSSDSMDPFDPDPDALPCMHASGRDQAQKTGQVREGKVNTEHTGMQTRQTQTHTGMQSIRHDARRIAKDRIR